MRQIAYILRAYLIGGQGACPAVLRAVLCGTSDHALQYFGPHLAADSFKVCLQGLSDSFFYRIFVPNITITTIITD